MTHFTPTGNESRFLSGSDTKHLLAKAFGTLFFLMFIFQFGVKAQSPPACSLTGPLQASVRGSNIVVNVNVANSGANPTLAYSFAGNSSGAVIQTKGATSFNAANNGVTQQVTIAPGSTVGGFNLQLTVTGVGGTGQCSASVSVTN